MRLVVKARETRKPSEACAFTMLPRLASATYNTKSRLSRTALAKPTRLHVGIRVQRSALLATGALGAPSPRLVPKSVGVATPSSRRDVELDICVPSPVFSSANFAPCLYRNHVVLTEQPRRYVSTTSLSLAMDTYHKQRHTSLPSSLRHQARSNRYANTFPNAGPPVDAR